MAAITLLRPDPADVPEPVARPRIVLGLDAFGHEVLTPLIRPRNAIVEPRAAAWDGAEALIDEALADPAWLDVETIEPTMVALVDLGDDAADELATGLRGLVARTLAAQLTLSVIVVARLLERGPGRVDLARAKYQIETLVTEVLAPGQPGHGRVSIILVANRDGAGHVLDPAATVVKARYLVSLLLDPRAGDDPRFRRGLAPLATGFGEAREPWAWTAAFAAVDLKVFAYPAPEVAAVRARQLLAWLDPALAASPPTSWEPAVPKLGRVGVELDTRLGHPALPRWSPDPWRPVAEEAAAAGRAVAEWIERARAWNEEQQRRVAARRLALTDEGATSLAAYQEQVRAGLGRLPRDESVPGLWPSLERWLAAARTTVSEPPPGAEPAIPPPLPRLAPAEARMQAAIARRTNGRFASVAAGATVLLATGLIVAATVTESVLPNLAAAWNLAAAAFGLPGPGGAWAIAGAALMVSILSWLTLVRTRLGLERAWEQAVHLPAVSWTRVMTAHHRATLSAQAARVERDIGCRAGDDLLAIGWRAGALRAAFAPGNGHDTASSDEDDRFTRRIEPSPRQAPTAAPDAAARAIRSHPELADWLGFGVLDDAAALRDRLLETVAGAEECGLAADAPGLQRVMDLLARVGSDARRATCLKPHALATPRWTTADFLVVPASLLQEAPVIARNTTVLPGDDDRIVALSLISGLTAADLFGPIEERCVPSDAKEMAP